MSICIRNMFSSISPILGFILWVCFMWTSLPAYAANVTQMFNHALKLYEQKNYKQAAKLLNNIVSKYSTHEPSHIILARIYYRSGMMARAAWHFKRVSQDSVDGETAYEYGMTFFSRGQCKRADQGLRRVGSSTRGTNLAYFYRAVCYARSKQWYRAEQFLEKAQNLPPHLVDVRRSLLRQVQQAQDREQKYQQTTQTITPPPLVLEPPPADLALSEKESKLKKSTQVSQKMEPPKTGLTTTLAPDLSLTIQSAETDFNGTQTQHNDTSSIKLGALGTFKQLFNPLKNGAQPYGSLTLAFSQVSTDSNGKKVKTQAYSDSPDQSFETTTNLPKVSSHILRLSAAPEIGYPVLKSTEVTLGGKLETLKPQETTIPSATATTGNAAVNITVGAISLTGSGDYSQFQIVDPKSTTPKGFNRMRGSGTITQNWTNGFFIDFNGIYAIYAQQQLAPAGPTYIGEINSGNALMNGTTFDGETLELGASAGKKFENAKFKTKLRQSTYTATNTTQFFDGANDIFAIETSLEMNFEMGSSLVLNGSYQEVGTYQKEIDKPTPADKALTLRDSHLALQVETPPEKVLALATASRSSASAGLKLSPFEGLTGKLSLGYDQTALLVKEREFEETLLKSTPSSSISVTFEIGYNRSF